MCRKRIRRASENSDSENVSESASDVSFESEAADSDAESDDSGEADALGAWDDADAEQYAQVGSVQGEAC